MAVWGLQEGLGGEAAQHVGALWFSGPESQEMGGKVILPEWVLKTNTSTETWIKLSLVDWILECFLLESD